MIQRPKAQKEFIKTLTEEFVLNKFEEHIASGSSAVSFSGNLGVSVTRFRDVRAKFPNFDKRYREVLDSRVIYTIHGKRISVPKMKPIESN